MKMESTYNDAVYWQERLKEHSVWKGVFLPEQKTGTAIIVNSIIANQKSGIYINDWASYPSTYALLGFIQCISANCFLCGDIPTGRCSENMHNGVL
jgi:hypothetical protein